MAHNEDDDMTVVPIPGEDNEAERQRIRKSNDRDQERERHGEPSRHNRVTTRRRTAPCEGRNSSGSWTSSGHVARCVLRSSSVNQ
jgi:hypothetical protein